MYESKFVDVLGSYMQEMCKPDTTWSITPSDMCNHLLRIIEQYEKTTAYKEIHIIF